MRALFVALAIAATTHSNCAPGAEPEVFEVVVEGAPLRAGPHDEHYVTQHLPRGQVVEVYRSHEQDWLGVRPLESSFSWIRRGDLETTNVPDLARARDGAVVYVGSKDSELKDLLSQVTLREREVCVLLAPPESRTIVDEDRDMWVRVSPPSGEFRWIHRRYVRPATDSPEFASTDDATRDSTQPDTNEVRQATFTETDSASSPEKTADSASDPPAGWQAAQPAKRKGDTESSETVRMAKAPASMTFSDRLRAISLEFSLRISGPVEGWKLVSLLRQADQLENDATTPVELAEVRSLIESLREADDLHRRHRVPGALAELASDDKASKEEPGLLSQLLRSGDHDDDVGPIGSGVRRASEGLETDASSESLMVDLDGDLVQYDGTGWLLPVHSKRRTAPPFALMDDEGNVLTYVSPAPGLNLHRYVRKEVGIMGRRGYVPTLKGKHLTAERVIDLERHRR